jgi:hypothetical protein
MVSIPVIATSYAFSGPRQNHQGYADYYLIHALASRAPRSPRSKPAAAQQERTSNMVRERLIMSEGYGMLGKCRYFAKKSLVWQVPVFGCELDCATRYTSLIGTIDFSQSSVI